MNLVPASISHFRWMEISSLSAIGGATQSCSTSSTVLSIAPGPAPIWLGSSGNAGHEFANSYISEVLYFQSALTLEQVASVQAYLVEKWGLVLQSDLALPPFPPSPPPLPPPLAPESAFLSAMSPGLVMWLDAADTTTLLLNSSGNATVTSSGQTVSLWKDKSGTGNDVGLAVGFGAAPTWSQALMTGSLPGGRPSLDFTQSGGFVSSQTAAKSLNVTLFLVAAVKSPLASAVLWGHFGNATVNGTDPQDADICLRRSGSATSFDWHSSSDSVGCAIAFTPDVPYLYTATMLGGASR